MHGDEIRKARKARGWSQAELAQRAGVSQRIVSAIELGEREGLPTIRRVAAALGLELVLQPVKTNQQAAASAA